MSTRLEPVYLANVLLFITNKNSFTVFPFVSKRCHEAMLTLKTNPAGFCHKPSAILKLFPNINTMVVEEITDFNETDVIPDTVTAIVVKYLNFEHLTKKFLKLADRIVEVRNCYSNDEHPADFTLFPNLERLSLDGVPEHITLPTHKLKRLSVHSQWYVDPLSTLPSECAEQIVFVFTSPRDFAEAKAQQLPPHVRVFCTTVGEGVTPEDLYNLPSSAGVTLSEAFGVDELRAFNEVLPLPFSDVEVVFDRECAKCDISFLTGITCLNVNGMKNCTLTLPVSVVRLTMSLDSMHVRVSGTENLTHLFSNMSVTTTPCPKLQELTWWGGTLSEKALPLPISDVTTLSELTVGVEMIHPDFRFPTQLTALELKVFNKSFDVALLTPLTRLQVLTIDICGYHDALDMWGLTTLTRFDGIGSPISSLPTSLVRCKVSLQCNFDFSSLTNLTWLSVSLKSGLGVTFPTGLKMLCVDKGELANTNISDVELESFDSAWDRDLTHDELEMLPMTLKKISGNFRPESLKDHLPAMFPLLEQ